MLKWINISYKTFAFNIDIYHCHLLEDTSSLELGHSSSLTFLLAEITADKNVFVVGGFEIVSSRLKYTCGADNETSNFSNVSFEDYSYLIQATMYLFILKSMKRRFPQKQPQVPVHWFPKH